MTLNRTSWGLRLWSFIQITEFCQLKTGVGAFFYKNARTIYNLEISNNFQGAFQQRMMTWTQAWRTEDLGTGSTNKKPQADEDHRQAFVVSPR